jgi:hypothetical protein
MSLTLLGIAIVAGINLLCSGVKTAADTKTALDMPKKLAALGVPADRDFFTSSYLMTEEARLAINSCSNNCGGKLLDANDSAVLFGPALVAAGKIRACSCGGMHPAHGA